MLNELAVAPKSKTVNPSPVTDLAIVGGTSFPNYDLVIRKLLQTLDQAWPLERIFTIREDPVGRVVRRYARSYGWLRLGVAVSDQVYEDAAAVAVARLVWRSQRVIIYWDGSTTGLAADMIQVCSRMKRPFKVFEVKL